MLAAGVHSCPSVYVTTADFPLKTQTNWRSRQLPAVLLGTAPRVINKESIRLIEDRLDSEGRTGHIESNTAEGRLFAFSSIRAS